MPPLPSQGPEGLGNTVYVCVCAVPVETEAVMRGAGRCHCSDVLWHVPSGAFKLVVILLFLAVTWPIIEINNKKINRVIQSQERRRKSH